MTGEFSYRRANVRDVDILAEMHIEGLRTAAKLPGDADLAAVKEEVFYYYMKSFSSGEHTAYLVYDRTHVAGCGGISYYRVVPTYHNPTGRRAHITDLYTRPKYRRKGIATNVLGLLLQEAGSKNISRITLEATCESRPVYEKCGFVLKKQEMEYEGVLPQEKAFVLTYAKENEQDFLEEQAE